ncbi:MAG: hypothetical protein JRI25_04325 [Deltaproteobacteria bacterium]|nr:hypothetical protein [Deltaproteobacteria bacterium]MBW2253806.1 hypothetical protein [Deltaproteobacteria bacterium]
MKDQDVWEPGEDLAPSTVRRGVAAYGEGLWINQAFSLEVVFRYALALLREQPGFMLGMGVALWLAYDLPTLLGLPGEVGVAVLRQSGEEMAGTTLDLMNSLLQLGLSLVLFPIQWLLVTGSLIAITNYMRTDELSIRPVFTSLRETLWAIVYRVLVTLAMMAILALVSLPVAVIVGGLVYAEAFGVALVVGIVGAVLVFVIYLWVYLPLTLGTLAVILDGAGPLEAMRIGWLAGSGSRATLFVFGLAFLLLLLAGMCLMCVGQIPVFAMFLGGVAPAWLLYARSEEELAEWPFFQRHPLP